MVNSRPVEIPGGFVLEEKRAGRSVQLTDLQSSDGYWGADGLVRLKSDGTNKRALQLKQKRGNRDILIEAAESFNEKATEKNDETFMLPTTESVDSTSMSLEEW